MSPSRRCLLGLGGKDVVISSAEAEEAGGVAAPGRAIGRSGAYSESICLPVKAFYVAPQRGRPASRTTLFGFSWRFQTPEKGVGGRMNVGGGC